jgi:hypothetical protein
LIVWEVNKLSLLYVCVVVVVVVVTVTLCILGWAKEDGNADSAVSSGPIQQKLLPVLQASSQLQEHGAVQVVSTCIYLGIVNWATK